MSLLIYMYSYYYLIFDLLVFKVSQYYNSIVLSLLNTYYNFIIVFIITCSFYYNKYVCYLFLYFKWLHFNNFFIFKQLPNTLIVGYNNIHPILFYIGFIICLLYFFNTLNKFNLIKLIFILSFALLLGGLWGLGNSSWGFFWVNDYIEIILLFLIIISVVVLHIHTNINLNFILFYYIYTLCSFLFFLRWGLTFTRHNFINVHSLCNIIISYTILNYKILPFYFLFFIYNLKIISILLCIYFSIMCITNLFNFKNLIYHIFLLSLCFTWVKFKIHNFTFFNNYKQYLLFTFFDYNNFLSNYLCKMLSYKLTFLNNSIFTIYVFKITNIFFIISSYWVVYLLVLIILTLLSILL